ncbi:MAG TPA: 7-carboxy-7-deazaguanine synthase QueE [Bacteroidota bacterium]
MKSLVINEIFHSIQGESSYMGLPCVFVRLTYCNLRCSYCDTEYAFHEGTSMSIESIIEKVKEYKCRLVEITGGEPLAQDNVHDLMSRLCDLDFEVLLETGGSLDISRVDGRVERIMDIKTPSSGMEKKNLWENILHLKVTDEIKFVVGDRNDFEWAVQTIRQHQLEDRCPVLFSPVFGELSPRELSGWILEEGLNARFQLQMHKYIWEPEARGV